MGGAPDLEPAGLMFLWFRPADFIGSPPPPRSPSPLRSPRPVAASSSSCPRPHVPRSEKPVTAVTVGTRATTPATVFWWRGGGRGRGVWGRRRRRGNAYASSDGRTGRDRHFQSATAGCRARACSATDRVWQKPVAALDRRRRGSAAHLLCVSAASGALGARSRRRLRHRNFSAVSTHVCQSFGVFPFRPARLLISHSLSGRFDEKRLVPPPPTGMRERRPGGAACTTSYF